MGKTIQAISLMLENRPDFSDFAQMRDWATSDERHQHSSSAGGAVAELTKASTLIVLPTVAIRQWQTEIARFTRSGALTVKVYHGSDRNTTVQDLTTADVVLTSYKVRCVVRVMFGSHLCSCSIYTDGVAHFLLSRVTNCTVLLGYMTLVLCTVERSDVAVSAFLDPGD
jgi:hypothetical protein